MSTAALPETEQTSNQNEGSRTNSSSAEDLFNKNGGVGMGDVITAFDPKYMSDSGEIMMVDPQQIPIPGSNMNLHETPDPNRISIPSNNIKPQIEPVNIIVSSNNRNSTGIKKSWWGKQETANPLDKNLKIHTTQELARMQSASASSNDRTSPLHSPISTASQPSGIIYVQNETKQKQSNFKSICFSLTFGILLMYAMMLTYMVFVDPEGMVCNKVCDNTAVNDGSAVISDDDSNVIVIQEIPTMEPTKSPSKLPTNIPSNIPTEITVSPTTAIPTKVPSESPTNRPTGSQLLQSANENNFFGHIFCFC